MTSSSSMLSGTRSAYVRAGREPCDMCKNRSGYRGLTGDFVGSVYETPPDCCHLDLFIIVSLAFLLFKSTIAILVFPSIPLLCHCLGVVASGQRRTYFPPLLLCANRREYLRPCLPSTEYDSERPRYRSFNLIAIVPVFWSGYLDVRSFTGMDNNPPQAVTPSGASCYASNLSPADILYCKVQSPYGGTVCVQW